MWQLRASEPKPDPCSNLTHTGMQANIFKHRFTIVKFETTTRTGTGTYHEMIFMHTFSINTIINKI